MAGRKKRRPTELQEQIALVRALRRSRLVFAAVPNGGYRLRSEAVNLKASGVRRGFPDMLIFSTPERPNGGHTPSLKFIGVALEMKRVGSVPSDVSAEQRSWLSKLEGLGWARIVGNGAEDALQKLRDLGYSIKE